MIVLALAAPLFQIEHLANAGGLLRRHSTASRIQSPRHRQRSASSCTPANRSLRLLSVTRPDPPVRHHPDAALTIQKPDIVVAPWRFALSMRGRVILDQIIQAPAYWAIHDDLYPNAQIP